MPVQVSYPGVYIEEVPSGVRTITGVATSIAAFVGWVRRGPVDRPGLVLSWQDFERRYGGLDPLSPMSYSVYHFFANGGQQAYIVRAVPAPGGAGAPEAARLDLNGRLEVTAKDPGTWGNNYGITIRRRTTDPTRFALRVVQRGPNNTEVPVEVFENLSMQPTDRRAAATVISADSMLVNAAVLNNATQPPDDTATPAPALAGGADGTPAALNAPAIRAQLDKVDLFNMLCLPGETDLSVLQDLEGYCVARRAFMIIDSDPADNFEDLGNRGGPPPQLLGDNARNAAYYFPWVLAGDPLQENRPRSFPPCGFVAGTFARTDVARGVWKAPAGIDASLTGVLNVVESLTDQQNGFLNVRAVNCIRAFPNYGTVVWGARTLQGNDETGSEWKYIPVRRMALFIEESLYRGTKWVVFEPNDEPLWSQIRLNVGAFMHSLFRQGAFQGRSPREAYFVKCDKDTTTQNDINRGIVNIHVGFAPLKPAEFVIIKIQQMAGQIET